MESVSSHSSNANNAKNGRKNNNSDSSDRSRSRHKRGRYNRSSDEDKPKLSDKANSNGGARKFQNQPAKGGYNQNQNRFDNRKTNYNNKPMDRGNQKYQGHQNNQDSNKQIFVPLLEGPLVSYKTFYENQPNKVDKEKADFLYNKYKADWNKKQNEIFVTEHKEDEWFQEKYNPYKCEKQRLEKQEICQQSAAQFFSDLKNGLFERLSLQIDEDNINKKRVQQGNLSGGNKDDENDQQEHLSSTLTARNFSFTDILLDPAQPVTEAPYFGYECNASTLFIKHIPKHISRWDITTHLEKIPGFKQLSISEPQRTHDFPRYGWAIFDSIQHCEMAEKQLDALLIKNFTFTIMKSHQSKKAIKVMMKLDKMRVRKDQELTEKLIQALDQEKHIENNSMLLQKNSTEEEKQLDLQLLYLRKVHYYCYYCASEAQDEHMLSNKCGGTHLRLKVESDEIINVPDWHGRIVEMVEARFEKSKKICEQRGAEEEVQFRLDKMLENQIQKTNVTAGAWPCTYCDKIFSTDNFVIKHIQTKHTKEVKEHHDKEKNKVIEQIAFHNYQYDKNKIYGQFMNRTGYGSAKKQNFQKSLPQYKDLDDPVLATKTSSTRNVINYNDI